MNQEKEACQEINHIPKSDYSMEDLREIYSTHFSVGSVENLSIDAALHHIGTLIDLSLDLSEKDGLRKAIQLSKDLQNRCLSKKQECILDYFLGNAWANLKKLSKKRDENGRKEWENEEDEQEITHLRKALSGKGFNEIETDRQCQILTNLGNIMDGIGRPIESIEYKDKALELKPSFPMAIGNRGICLFHYGNILYDVGDKIAFFKFAHSNLETALSSELHPSARSAFKKYVEII
jgi:tetratricopeptide (TPR) repeat protein